MEGNGKRKPTICCKMHDQLLVNTKNGFNHHHHSRNMCASVLINGKEAMQKENKSVFLSTPFLVFL